MLKHFAARMMLAAVIGLLAQSALADPGQRGIIRNVDLNKGWVTIDSQRFSLTNPTHERLVIRNLAAGGDDSSALQSGLPVRFSTDSQNRLLEIWVYPADPALRAELGYGSPAE